MKCPTHLLAKPEITKILNFHKGEDHSHSRKVLIEEYILLLDDYYCEKNIETRVGYQTINFPGELLKNAYHHGKGDSCGVSLGIFLSPKIVVVGCNDGGDYFKDLEIKKMWEKRIYVETRGLKLDESGNFISGGNFGNRYIYGGTDEIFIDNESGTFFGKFDPLIYLLSYDQISEIQKKRKELRG